MANRINISIPDSLYAELMKNKKALPRSRRIKVSKICQVALYDALFSSIVLQPEVLSIARIIRKYNLLDKVSKARR